MYVIQREVNQELWNYIMESEGLDGSHSFENDVFQIVPYQWVEDNTYNFKHKPSGLIIEWYKYPLRGACANMPITPEKLLAVLYDCTNSLHPHSTHEVHPWWKDQQQ